MYTCSISGPLDKVERDKSFVNIERSRGQLEVSSRIIVEVLKRTRSLFQDTLVSIRDP